MEGNESPYLPNMLATIARASELGAHHLLPLRVLVLLYVSFCCSGSVAIVVYMKACHLFEPVSQAGRPTNHWRYTGR